MDALYNCRPLCLLGCWVGWVSCGSSWARQPGQPGQSGQKTQSSSVYLYIIRYWLTIKPFLRAPLLCQISKVRIMKIARWLKVLGHFELFFRPATNRDPLLQIETDLPQIEILSFELENKCQPNEGLIFEMWPSIYLGMINILRKWYIKDKPPMINISCN